MNNTQIEMLESNFNFMVIDRTGRKYRHYHYDVCKEYLRSYGGRLYAYRDLSLRKTLRILLEVKK